VAWGFLQGVHGSGGLVGPGKGGRGASASLGKGAPAGPFGLAGWEVVSPSFFYLKRFLLLFFQFCFKTFSNTFTPENKQIT
jgi:hypothetical protein